jgi:hypothetical protein
MDKEQVWKGKRLGCISASELNNLFSKSGKLTKEMMSYVRAKRFHRKHHFELPVSGRALSIGKEMEHDAVEWLRYNYPSVNWVYSQELDEIPFWKVDWAKFGASPDCFNEDESIVVEVKNCVGNDTVYYFDDEYTSEEQKRSEVIKEHGNQLIGQFLSNPKVKEIWLLKYIYQRDDVMEDLDSPTAPWRGKIFKFKREDFDLEASKDRIILFDKFIDSRECPSKLTNFIVESYGSKSKEIEQ